MQDTVFDPGLDDLLTVLVPFDVTDGSGFDSGESKCEIEPAVAGEKIDAGKYVHISPSRL